MKLYTTLNKISQTGHSRYVLENLLKNLGKTVPDDEPLDYQVIMEVSGLGNAIWCMRTAPEYNKIWRLAAVRLARSCEDLIADARLVTAINVAERYAHGMATRCELEMAYCEAYACVNRAHTSYVATDAACVAAAAASYTDYAADAAIWTYHAYVFVGDSLVGASNTATRAVRHAKSPASKAVCSAVTKAQANVAYANRRLATYKASVESNYDYFDKLFSGA